MAPGGPQSTRLRVSHNPQTWRGFPQGVGFWGRWGSKGAQSGGCAWGRGVGAVGDRACRSVHARSGARARGHVEGIPRCARPRRDPPVPRGLDPGEPPADVHLPMLGRLVPSRSGFQSHWNLGTAPLRARDRISRGRHLGATGSKPSTTGCATTPGLRCRTEGDTGWWCSVRLPTPCRR